MEAHVRVDPLDLPPAQRAERFRRELQETAPEDEVKLLRRYLDPDAPVSVGKVTIADRRGAAQVPWHQSTTKLGPPGTPTEIREGAFKAPPGTFAHPLPRRRDPLERVQSMTNRYILELKRGNKAVLETLLADICADYWKAGMPVTVDDLRRMAARSLEDAERRQKRNHRKLVASPYPVK